MKSRRKLISILLTLSLLVTLLVPMVGTASAATNYSISNVKTVKAGYATDTGLVGGTPILGTLQIDIPSLVLPNGYVYLTLPSSPTGYTWTGIAAGIPTQVNGNDNAIGAVTLQMTDSTNRMAKLTVSNVAYAGNDGRIVIGYNLGGVNATDGNVQTFYRGDSVANGMNMHIPSGVNGAVTLNMTAPSGSNLNGGTLAIANVGTGKVTVSSESVVNIGSGGTSQVGLVDIKEDVAGSLVNGSSSVKLTLPPGFSWRGNPAVSTTYWGNTNGVAFTTTDNNNRDLKLVVSNRNEGASFFAVQAGVDVDESVAKTGDIEVTVSGDSTTTPSTIIIGRYGDFSVTAEAVSKLDIVAGKSDAKLGEFSLNEALAGSLTEDRTITLTLPEGAKWTNYPVIDTDLSKAQDQVKWTDNQWKAVGTDNRSIKITISQNDASGQQNATFDPAQLVFKDSKVVTGPDFTPGDLKVTVGGSMGVTGDLLVATVTPVVTATADVTPDVKIGLPDQDAGSLTIVESVSGAIDSNKNWTYRQVDANGNYSENKLSQTSNSDQTRMEIKAPPGVRFTGLPTVAVTDGDLQIDQSGVKLASDGVTDDAVLVLPIKSQSTKASTIKVSGIKVTVDRTVPEGDLTLRVRGNAVNESLDQLGEDTWLPGALDAAKVSVAKCVTPAPGTTKATAVFKIGDSKFTMNGVDTTMDAAPYLKNDRTYLPIRFVAKAVGVQDSNIIWNEADQSVVLVKDATIVKLVIGSTTMTINGTPITMDTAPEIVDPGRTMLPVSWVAKALNASISWDDATQTVTVN